MRNEINEAHEAEEDSEKEVKFLIKVPYETLEGDYSGRIYVKEINSVI